MAVKPNARSISRDYFDENLNDRSTYYLGVQRVSTIKTKNKNISNNLLVIAVLARRANPYSSGTPRRLVVFFTRRVSDGPS